jgi:hypothetical protein
VQLTSADQFVGATVFETNRASFGSVTADGAGNVYLTSRYQGTVSFFGTSLASNRGSEDIFALKLNDNGALQWVVSAGGPQSDFGEGIAVDSAGDVYVTGAIDWENSTNYTAKLDATHSLKNIHGGGIPVETDAGVTSPTMLSAAEKRTGQKRNHERATRYGAATILSYFVMDSSIFNSESFLAISSGARPCQVLSGGALCGNYPRPSTAG